MAKPLFQNKIYVKKSRKHGFGVFAGKKIKAGELIEECYFVTSRGGDKTLEDYYFDAKGKDAIMFGYGCIYNHSEDPNADYYINTTRSVARIKAYRDIKKDEEICIDYGVEYFKTRNKKPK